MEKDAQHVSGHTPLSESRLLVVGVLRNCAEKVNGDVLRLQSAMANAKQLHWLLIESDSTDSTPSELAKLQNDLDNFKYISLGHLITELPLRTQRISRCRNEYIKEIRQSNAYKNIDYVIVADFDGINTYLTQRSIESCWERDNWDMCSANQRGPYYVVWALRHKYWSPNDCWAQYNFFRTYKTNTEDNLSSSVYSRMIELPANSNWIEVDSAFGGLAVYKRSLFNLAEYAGLTDDGNEICEHVHFHAKLKQAGAKLFINPQLINAKYTGHTLPLRFSKSLMRKAKGVARRTLRTLGRVTMAESSARKP
jgi:hypothetical protein